MSSVPKAGVKFVRAKELEAGDKCKIITEPDWEDGDYGKQYCCNVDFKGDTRKLKITMASCNEIAKVYGGQDSKDWINKELNLEAIKIMVAGEVKLSILATPTGANTEEPHEEETAWDS